MKLIRKLLNLASCSNPTFGNRKLNSWNFSKCSTVGLGNLGSKPKFVWLRKGCIYFHTEELEKCTVATKRNFENCFFFGLRICCCLHYWNFVSKAITDSVSPYGTRYFLETSCSFLKLHVPSWNAISMLFKNRLPTVI